jgi:ribonuclease HI
MRKRKLSQLNIAVKWVWVKGHAEVQRNEAADSGATSGKQGNEQAIQPQAVIRAHDDQRRKQMEPMTKMIGPMEGDAPSHPTI